MRFRYHIHTFAKKKQPPYLYSMKTPKDASPVKIGRNKDQVTQRKKKGNLVYVGGVGRMAVAVPLKPFP